MLSFPDLADTRVAVRRMSLVMERSWNGAVATNGKRWAIALT
jgi:hypothetical protein